LEGGVKISALEEYGLRCLVQVARSQDKGPLSIPEIARREGITVDYTTKLLTILRRGGLLKSVRGTQGGYLLARKPEEITLAQIMRLLGGPFFETTTCEHFPGSESQCVHLAECGVRSVWVGVTKRLFDMLNRLTLAGIMKDEASVTAFIDTTVLEV
jgi:Rrf2 family transcriptional regulator, iron-sulfur cluster assembly transcription factor